MHTVFIRPVELAATSACCKSKPIGLMLCAVVLRFALGLPPSWPRLLPTYAFVQAPLKLIISCSGLQGVLAMSWSPQDAGLLLSSGKDNRIILWDVTTGEMLGETPGADSWSFDVAWCPTNPGVFATSSYGGEGSSGKVCCADLQPPPVSCKTRRGKSTSAY